MSKKSYRFAINDYIKNKYATDPEFLWQTAPNYAVYRHADNRKWFALVMDIPKNKLGLKGKAVVDIVNVKLKDPLAVSLLTMNDGYFNGYHIRGGNWVSILLDGTVPLDEIYNLIDEGYAMTASAEKKKKIRPPKEWIIPANPKYYDIVHAFDDAEVIEWKQGAGIKEGDTVFMYVGAPISAIMYKCTVLETDIPYDYTDKNLTIKSIMNIKLECRYDTDKFTFAVLKDKYGIRTIRGPRGISEELSASLRAANRR